MRETLETYKVITKICNKAKDLTETNNKYISEFGLPLIGKVKDRDYKKKIQDYFDFLNHKILENFYLELFASFEAKVIQKIKLSSGGMRKSIDEHYPENLPFQQFEDKFVKNEEDLSSLNRILGLLENKIDENHYLELKTVVQYRDKLAHGKRFHEDVLLDSIEDTFKLLEKILDEL